jgi:hypothetical protein
MTVGELAQLLTTKPQDAEVTTLLDDDGYEWRVGTPTVVEQVGNTVCVGDNALLDHVRWLATNYKD